MHTRVSLCYLVSNLSRCLHRAPLQAQLHFYFYFYFHYSILHYVTHVHWNLPRSIALVGGGHKPELNFVLQHHTRGSRSGEREWLHFLLIKKESRVTCSLPIPYSHTPIFPYFHFGDRRFPTPPASSLLLLLRLQREK